MSAESETFLWKWYKGSKYEQALLLQEWGEMFFKINIIMVV
jgi:hypothetical protein